MPKALLAAGPGDAHGLSRLSSLIWGPSPRCPPGGYSLACETAAGARRSYRKSHVRVGDRGAARGLLWRSRWTRTSRGVRRDRSPEPSRLIAAERYREAIRYCQQELAASPRCVTLRLWLARAFLADGAGAKGVAELEECLRIDPTSGGSARAPAGSRRGRAVAAVDAEGAGGADGGAPVVTAASAAPETGAEAADAGAAVEAGAVETGAVEAGAVEAGAVEAGQRRAGAAGGAEAARRTEADAATAAAGLRASRRRRASRSRRRVRASYAPPRRRRACPSRRSSSSRRRRA